MDLNQLEYFRIVARYENVTQASKELYVAQSTLSQSILRLEEELGLKLFDRQKGKLHLNDAGKIFLNRVENILTEYNSAVIETKQFTEETTSKQWIPIASSVIDIAKDFMLQYHITHPNVCINHTIASDDAILDMLLDNKVDVIITPNEVDDPRLETTVLFQEEVFAVVGRTHPLSGRKSVRMDELRQLPMVCNSSDSDAAFMERFFGCPRRKLNIIASSNESHIPRRLTDEGYCFGLIPARIAIRHLKTPETQIVLKIEDSPFLRTCCISIHKTRTLSKAAERCYRDLILYCRADHKKVDAFLKQYYDQEVHSSIVL